MEGCLNLDRGTRPPFNLSTDFNCKVEIKTSGNIGICGEKMFKLSDVGSISHLKRHLKRHHPTEYDLVEKDFDVSIKLFVIRQPTDW